MEAEVALVASVVGVSVSGWLIRDAWRDRKVYLAHNGYHSPTLDRMTEGRLVGEIARGVVQWSFLLVALAVVLEINVGRVGEAVTWLLALIPAMIAGWSIYEWWGRKKLLEGAQVNGKQRKDDDDAGR